MYSVGHRFIYFLIIYNAVFGIAYYCTGVGFTKIILRKKFLKFLKINSKFLRTSFFFWTGFGVIVWWFLPQACALFSL